MGLIPYLCTGQLAQLQEAPQVQSLPHILDELVVGWLLVVMELAKWTLYSIVRAVWAMEERERGSMGGVTGSIYVCLPWYGNQPPKRQPPLHQAALADGTQFARLPPDAPHTSSDDAL